MRTVNMFEAKSTLSRLVEAVENGVDTEILIARNGRPVARLLPIAKCPKGQRIGVAKTDFDFLPDDPELDAAVVAMFTGGKAKPRNRGKAKS